MKVKELIECLTVDEQTDKPIDPNSEVKILTGWMEMAEILSIYTSGDELCIDIGDE